MNRQWSDAAANSLMCVAALCGVEIIDYLLPAHLDLWGIVPRTVIGLRGIVFSPLLHANFIHLISNVLPLLMLLTILLADRHYRPVQALAAIWLASGCGTWLIGRGGAVHIGASSMVYGLAAYLMVAAFFLRQWRPAFMALLIFVLYGGIFYGVLPRSGPVSWEGHLSGAVAGIWAASRLKRGRGRLTNRGLLFGLISLVFVSGLLLIR